MENLLATKSLVAALVFGLLFLVEQMAPFFRGLAGRPRARLRHDLRNLGLGLLNAAVLGLGFSFALAFVLSWARPRGIGLLNLVPLPGRPWLSTAVAVLLVDLWMYVWHRLNHEVPFLWRFHRVHHGDPDMDASTAFRFHTGEVLFSTGLRLLVLPLIGVTLVQAVVYESLFLPIVLFHHANVRFPERWDRFARLILVTPAVHRVHHSRVRVETDSNYGSILTGWDRAFRTFRLRDARALSLGLDGMDEERDQTLVGMLRAPFLPAPSPVGGPSGDRAPRGPMPD